MRKRLEGRRHGFAAWVITIVLAACGGGGGDAPSAPAPGSDPDPVDPAPSEPVDPECAGGSFDSTFAAIQELVFERHGCTAEACHGSARSGGLDLRAGAAYASLFEVPSQGSPWQRLVPGEPSESFLFQKLSASTFPGSFEISGSPMPVAAAPLGEHELEALRIWIEAGAPETGSVGDSVLGTSEYIEGLLGACLPPATPITIAPLEPPAPDEGVQFRMPTYLLPAATEREVCFAQYYDWREVVPARFQDPERGIFFVNGSRLRQDPHSHHLVIDHSGLGAEFVDRPEFGAWTCKAGSRDGQPCDPFDPTACDDGLCGSAVTDSIACIGYGPAEGAVDVAGGGIGGAQTAQQYDPPREGVYYELPISGILYWNSHAFNLTTEDHHLNARQNYAFAEDRRFRQVSIVDVHAIYIQGGQAPFTIERYCSEHVLERGARLLSLSSHTHKRGRNFTVDLADGSRIYQSFSYSDPVDESYDPPLFFDSPDPAQRTLTYCADFNNGVKEDGSPDLRFVTRLSTMPDRTSCKPVACVAGKLGEPCNGADDDAACDSSPGAGDGWCDACAITAGVTTENEMFVLTGRFIEP
jgi:hypothetical protein